MSTVDVISQANALLAEHGALVDHVRASRQNHARQLQLLETPPAELLRLPPISPVESNLSDEELDSPPASPINAQPVRPDLPPGKRARVAKYRNYVPEEETIRNDYSQRYVDSGEWPQNWVLGAEPERRFEEYPKQQRLLSLKKASVKNTSLAPLYLPFAELTSLHPSKFDVILLDPPFSSKFTWDNLQELPIPSLAADPSFIFLWVGSGAGEGLERGREVLAKWGYRRCEDIVWVKTNKTMNQGPGTDPPTTSLFTRTKQHCLIGIRGTVRRSSDHWFVHCNVDTDVIIWEGDPDDPTRKPPEMYTLIENFCLGLRRLEIFGRCSSLRRGWVTVFAQGHEERMSPDGIYVEGEEGGVATRWNYETWDEGIKNMSMGGKPVVPNTAEIDALRPKSPMRPGQANPSLNSGQVSGGQMNTAVGPRLMAPRPGFANNPMVQNQFLAQNAMMMGPMMGMAPQMGMGMVGMGGHMEEMMGGWVNGMPGMTVGNMGGMGPRHQVQNIGLGQMASGVPGGGHGLVNMPMQMMGQMGGFQGGGAGYGPPGGAPMFNPGLNNQYGMEGNWEGENMGNMMGGMGMGMNGMNMGNQHWGGSGPY